MWGPLEKRKNDYTNFSTAVIVISYVEEEQKFDNKFLLH